VEALDAGQPCGAADACVADLVSRGIGFGVVLPLLPRLLHRHAAAVWSIVAAECAGKVLTALATVAELATSTALPRYASTYALSFTECVYVHMDVQLC
jgi:hypothetical protein